LRAEREREGSGMFGFAKHLFHGGTHWVSHHWKPIVVIGE
jgi:hypothetical protein